MKYVRFVVYYNNEACTQEFFATDVLPTFFDIFDKYVGKDYRVLYNPDNDEYYEEFTFELKEEQFERYKENYFKICMEFEKRYYKYEDSGVYCYEEEDKEMTKEEFDELYKKFPADM